MLQLDPCSLTLVLRAQVTRVNVTGQLSIGDGLLDMDDFVFTNLGATSVTGTYTWNLFQATSLDSTNLGSNTTRNIFGSYSATLAISGIMWCSSPCLCLSLAPPHCSALEALP